MSRKTVILMLLSLPLIVAAIWIHDDWSYQRFEARLFDSYDFNDPYGWWYIGPGSREAYKITAVEVTDRLAHDSQLYDDLRRLRHLGQLTFHELSVAVDPKTFYCWKQLRTLRIHNSELAESALIRMIEAAPHLIVFALVDREQPLSVELFRQLNRMPDLAELDLSGACFDAQAFSELHPGKLRKLKLSRCVLDRGSLEHLSQLPIERLRLCDTVLQEDFGPLLFQIPTLRELDLAWSEIDKSTFDHFDATSQLSNINLSGTRIDDDTLGKLAQSPILQTLIVANCSISDRGARLLVNSSSLTRVDADHTPLTDEALNQLLQIKSLVTLSLIRTHVTDDAIKSHSQSGRRVRVKNKPPKDDF